MRAIALSLGLVLAACGGAGTPDASTSEGASESASVGDRPIVASTTVWASIVSEIACGEPVYPLIPAGADPHSFEPSLRDRGVLERATLVVANGAGLESSSADLLDTVAASGVDVVEVANHVDLLDHGDDDHDDAPDDHDEAADDHDEAADDHDEADDHGHGEGDPHVWQDPLRVAGTVDVIASALSAGGYDTCEDEVRADLTALDAELRRLLAPVEHRVLVTSHDSLAYFADRYDFEIVGTVIPSTTTMAEASAGQLADLAELITERDVRAIFTDAFESSGDADALARRLDVAVVPLVTDALTDDTPTYADMMRANATAIAEALAP